MAWTDRTLDTVDLTVSSLESSVEDTPVSFSFMCNPTSLHTLVHNPLTPCVESAPCNVQLLNIFYGEFTLFNGNGGCC